MGAKVRFPEKAPLGEFVIEIAAPEGYRLWSAAYDDTANPLLALETRILRQHLHPLVDRKVFDVASGTGRWAVYAASQGAQVLGIDLSPEMISVASRKPSLSGRLSVADMRCLPFADASADLAICSFALGYLESVRETLAELARVARQIVVTDLHPLAAAAGWARSFCVQGQAYRIKNYTHSLADIDVVARGAGLKKLWDLEARFGAPEQHFFTAAGKHELFRTAQQVPAFFAKCWSRP